MNIDIHAPDLAAFWPGLQGQLIGQAQVSGTREKPALALQLTGNALRFQEYTLAKLNADVHLDSQGDGHLEVKIEASDLQAAGTTIQSLSLNAGGEFAQHQLSATINSSLGQLDTQITGAYQKGDWFDE